MLPETEIGIKPVRKVKVPFFIKLTSGMVRSAAGILIKDSRFFRKLNKQQSAFLTRNCNRKGGKKFLANILSLLSNLLQKEHIQKDNIQAMK